MRTLVILGTLFLLVAAVYSAPAEEEDPEALDEVEEDEESDPEELAEDSGLDELDDDEEDPAKRKRRRKPRYKLVQFKRTTCFCGYPKFLKKKKGDEPEEDEDDLESVALPVDAMSDEEELLSDQVEEVSSDPKKKKGKKSKVLSLRRKIQMKISKILRFKLFLHRLFLKHFKLAFTGCRCTRNAKIARIFRFLHFNGRRLKMAKLRFLRRLMALIRASKKPQKKGKIG